MTIKADVLFRHYSTISKRICGEVSDLADMLKEISYDIRDGYGVQTSIDKATEILDSAIKGLNNLRILIRDDLDNMKKE